MSPFSVSVTHSVGVEEAKTTSSTGSFSSALDGVYTLKGAGTETITLSSTDKAKKLQVSLPREGNTAPVTIRLNGSPTGIELSPGGLLVIASPTPSASGNAASVTIVYSVDSVVHCAILT